MRLASAGDCENAGTSTAPIAPPINKLTIRSGIVNIKTTTSASKLTPKLAATKASRTKPDSLPSNTPKFNEIAEIKIARSTINYQSADFGSVSLFLATAKLLSDQLNP